VGSARPERRSAHHRARPSGKSFDGIKVTLLVEPDSDSERRGPRQSAEERPPVQHWM